MKETSSLVSHRDDSQGVLVAKPGTAAQSAPRVAAEWPRLLPTVPVLVGVLLSVAIALRLTFLLCGRSLWTDEAALALNVVDRSFGQLFAPLDYGQAAPVGFLLVTKVLVLLFGPGETVFRFIPFLAGVGALLLTYRWVRLEIGPSTAIVALALLVLASPLVYYSGEFKQYSGDALVTVLLLNVCGRSTWSNTPLHRSWIGAAVAAVLVWCSHPAVFVLAGIWLVHGVAAARSGLSRRSVIRLASGSLWGVSFLLFFFVSLQATGESRSLMRFWRDGFAPFPPASADDLSWYVSFLMDGLFGSIGLPHSKDQDLFAWLRAALLAAGVWALWRQRPSTLGTLIAPLVAVLGASVLQRYPAADRLLLFVAPLVAILIAEGTVGLARLSRWSVGPSFLLLGVLFSPVLIPTSTLLADPRERPEARPALEYVAAHLAPDDQVYVYGGWRFEFHFYADRLGIPLTQRLGDLKPVERHLSDLDSLQGEGQVWVITEPDGRRDAVNRLEKLGRLEDKFSDFSVSAHLYRFS